MYNCSWTIRRKILTVKGNHMVLNDWQVFTTIDWHDSETLMLQERVRVQMCVLEAVHHWLLPTDSSTRPMSRIVMEQKVSSLTFFIIIPKSYHWISHLTRLKTDIIFSLLDLLLLGERTQEEPGRSRSSVILMYYVTSGSSKTCICFISLWQATWFPSWNPWTQSPVLMALTASPRHPPVRHNCSMSRNY